MRSARLFLSTLLCLLPGAGFSLASLSCESTEFLQLSTWDPDYPKHLSDFEEVSIWGWPRYWVIDDPYGGRSGRIDLAAEWRLGPGLANWLWWSLGSAFLLNLVRLRRLGRQAERQAPSRGSVLYAAVVAPFSVFFVVQALLPIVRSGSSPSGFFQDLRFATTVAYYATAATYAVVLILGIPAALALRRAGRFTCRRVLPIGAVVGAVPFLPAILTALGRLTDGSGIAAAGADLLGTLVFVAVGAASGLACAFVLWLTAVRMTPPSATGSKT